MNLGLPENWSTTLLILIGVGILCSLLIEWLTRTLGRGAFGWQRALRRRLGVADGQPIRELRWLGVGLQLLLWPLLGYALLRLWELDDVGELLRDKLLGKGISIGGSNIVPGKVLFGLLAFLLLVTFTRWFRRKLQYDWLPRTGMEMNTRVSLATLFGYVTFTLAVLVGLSAAGLDLSKITIVAGALSVGIGFGLQNIFNNFVSGLILLFERPVRLGDYIKIGTTEGFVRNIRIRATELQGWDRGSIIVPNSVLLSSTVENFNYRDNLGRSLIRIPLPQDCDLEKVTRLLLQAAQSHPNVLQKDQHADVGGPFVSMVDITETQLVLELGAYVSDVNSKGGVASDLRFEALRLFRENGIELAQPPRELWLRREQRAAATEADPAPAIPGPQ